MAERLDKQGRKAALAAWKVGQQAATRGSLPLPADQMKTLFDMLNVEFPRQGCDHTLRLTRGWLVAEGLTTESVVEWLQANGGYCDCSALANAEQVWLAVHHSG